ncbi:hypothetical protein HJC23_011926 [Cyclotella cryptica]|uniref:Fe2OG dioxygenase domain-containing protein n=1 Tax=Cyclotella cryptica TaxID=29204 RepID=A0ABD3NNW1_9STRA|eukprot:CCRYP_020468-RA/>CCRYP_020468-RA protein AED:0.47 eAED:0.47 QI:0/-1/0/1/-1/1/1/0/348
MHLVAITLLLCLILLASGQLDENERITEYHKRKHKWPPVPTEFIPHTPGWRSLHERRLKQVARVEDEYAKYNGYMTVVHSALMSPNFTEHGWALTRGPPDLVDTLLQRLMDGLNSPDTRVEEYDHEVHNEYPLEPPLMVSIPGLHERVLHELQPIHEAWSGVKLVGNNAYGLRVYRNQSNLQMHVDESATHIISSILHIGHDPNGEPWPLVIEDFQGDTHEVFLETGDMILYESSKCFHGRPKRYNGEWYSSIFTHYYPVDWDRERINIETHYRIPPGWSDLPEEDIEGLEKLVVSETSFREPACEHEWCGLRETKKWEMPEELKLGQVVSSDGVIKSLGIQNNGDEL